MKIYYIASFKRIWDEEGIARTLEELGHTVIRREETWSPDDILSDVKEVKPDIVLFAKAHLEGDVFGLIQDIKELGIPTASWTFDLWWGYVREPLIKDQAFFTCDYVFTSDGGHDKEWKLAGINHHLLRQGIYEPQAFYGKPTLKFEADVVFVGCVNPHYPYRQRMLGEIRTYLPETFRWWGVSDQNEVRGTLLNDLYASAKIIMGDSVESPRYWSNRIYETLGRGGFLIHPEIEGLEEEFEYGMHFVSYQRGDLAGLMTKIRYYLEHDEEREEIRRSGFEYCKNNYGLKKRCADLIQIINATH